MITNKNVAKYVSNKFYHFILCMLRKLHVFLGLEVNDLLLKIVML